MRLSSEEIMFCCERGGLAQTGASAPDTNPTSNPDTNSSTKPGASLAGGEFTVLPAGTDGSAGPSATYVTFGLWPQSVLPVDSAVTVNENDALTVGLFTYYAGSDGFWYVKQEEKAYYTGDAYKYSDGTQVKEDPLTTYLFRDCSTPPPTDGSYVKLPQVSRRYFRVEPIKWRLLEETEGKKFLLAETCLMQLTYYDSNTRKRTIDGSKVPFNNYKHSKIRAWLNGYTYNKEGETCTDYENNGFLQTAFSDAAQAKIATTTVDNSVESTRYATNQFACENTSDKVFLLSAVEASNTRYGFKAPRIYGRPNSRIREPSDFALATGAYQDGYSHGSTWWLRSPHYYYAKRACCIYLEADLFAVEVAWSGSTVVPALWVD